MSKILFFLIFLFLLSCGAIEDSLTLKKKNNSDEFLVEKKNPLVLPPNFGILPKPGEEIMSDESPNIVKDDIIINGEKIKSEKSLKSSSIEKIILEKIK